ncbi:hypothetical protein ABZV31_16135 [Streptomyces sp. NPDC005202]|uniref:hypothetical protein n=1 Tax=Streptomyces sp. NPDC005202 TaxID=3157021 RepID=UPI0033B9D174
MLALRLTRVAHPAVQLRRLTVAAASAGTGFLLLSTLGYALGHPEDSAAAVLRLSWCAVPLVATVYLAVAVAHTDPGSRPRPGLSALGLGPGRLMAVSAATTALSCVLGSMLALLLFLHLRGDLTGMPFDGPAPEFLAADEQLPVPAALTLLSLVPAIASVSVALVLRPRDTKPAAAGRTARKYGRFGAYGRAGTRENFGTYGRFGAHFAHTTRSRAAGPARTDTADGRSGPSAQAAEGDGTQPPLPAKDSRTAQAPDSDGAQAPRQSAGSRAAGAARVGAGGTPSAPGCATDPLAATDGILKTPVDWTDAFTDPSPDPDPAPHRPPAPRQLPVGLPWGIAVVAVGLAVEAYASHTVSTPSPTLPGGLAAGSAPVLAGWLLTALGLALAGPGLTHLCGRLLQSARPGALRLLAGRVLMEEAGRIGRPLGVVCAVASGTYAMVALYGGAAPAFGPLTTLGTLLVTCCALTTLLTAAVEARQARADTMAALLRLGAPPTLLRTAAALRTAALLALFAPLTLVIADLAALPLAR